MGWLLAACGPGDAGPADRLGPPAFTLEGPEVRIGAVDDPDFAFSAVTAVVEAPDGRIYTLHRNEAFVRRWTPDGRPDGRIGRAGEGPGEFGTPYRIGFFGDSLWVVDLRTYRASFFDAAGTFLGQVTPRVRFASAQDGPTASPPRPQVPLRGGGWYGIKPAWSEEIANGDLSRIPHVRMTSDGDVTDTAWVQHSRTHDILSIPNQDGPGGLYGRQPFGDDDLVELTAEGHLLVVGRRAWSGQGPAEMTFARLGLDGDTLAVGAIPYEPEALTPTRIDEAVDEGVADLTPFFERTRPGLSAAGIEETYRSAVYAPAHVPAVRGGVVDGSGGIWLRRSSPENGQAVHWVVDRNGTHVGTVRGPESLELFWIGDDHAWGVETDAFDVNYLVRYGIAPVSAAGN